MIRDLFVNEELLITLDKDSKLSGVIKRENAKWEVRPTEIQFIRQKARIMEKLQEGNQLQVTTDGTTTTSSIAEHNGVGFSVPASIEELEFNLNAKRR